MKPILRDIPLQIESDRLIIRCAQPGDGRAVYEAVVETLEDLRAWPASLPWAMHEPSVEASETFCRESYVEYLARKGFPMLAFLKSDNVFVAASGLHGLDWSVPAGEIGYWCRKTFQGRGLATEAVMAISSFAIQTLGVQRIISRPDAENSPSCRVAEHAGYILEGTLRNERRSPDGSLRNTCLYSLTN